MSHTNENHTTRYKVNQLKFGTAAFFCLFELLGLIIHSKDALFAGEYDARKILQNLTKLFWD
jgi:hypothetical protein